MSEVIAGQSPNGNAYNDRGEGLPFYQGKKEFSDKYIGVPTTWTTEVTKVAEVGDILMSVRAPVGPINLAAERACIGRGLAAIRPGQRLELSFLRYALLWLQPQIVGSEGAVFPSINRGQIAALHIPLPPLEEQQRIVAVLDEAFEGLTRARAHAEANLQNARELFASYLGSIAGATHSHTDEISIRDLVQLGMLARPQDGNHGEIHPKKADFVSVGVPFIMASDLIGGSVDQQNCNFISLEQADRLRVGFARNGDVLLSHKGTIGRTAILETKHDFVLLTPQVTYYRVLDQTRLLNDFLYFVFQTAQFQHQINRAAMDGATRAYIGITRQLDLTLHVPNIETQLALISQCQSLEAIAPELVEGYQSKLQSLDALRQSLLQKAFAGELTQGIEPYGNLKAPTR